MEPKKTDKYDLEQQRPLFFSIGMVITLSLTLVAFEWKSPIDPVIELDDWIVIECSFPSIPVPLDSVTVQEGPPTTVWSDEGLVLTNNLKYKAESNASDNDSFLIYGANPPAEDPPLESYLIDDMIYTIVEVMPKFKGGEEQLSVFIDENLRYPNQSKRMGVEGRVFVKFVVEKDGKLSNAEVIRGIGVGCDEEALRVVNLFPKFSPGTMGGVPVRVQMVIPIKFKL